MDPAAPLLRDIHLPPEPGLWPPGLLAWLLLATVLLALYLLRLGLEPRWRAWRERRRLRRQALDELNRLCVEIPPQQRHGHLHQWLRRVAIALDRDSARLQGSAWANWLDQRAGERLFADGPGAQWLQSVYLRPPGDAQQLAVVEAVLRRWLERVL